MKRMKSSLVFVLLLAAGPAIVPGADLASAAPAFASFFARPTTPSKPTDPEGFLQRWLLLEPIVIPIRSNAELTDSFVQATIKKEYFPNQFSIIPRDGEKVTVGGEELTWHAVDALDFNVNLYHFALGLGKPTFNVLFWGVTVVHAPDQMRNVRLAVGCNSACVWWVNGKEVVALYLDRHMVVDDGVSKRLTLNKGPNVVRFALINSPGLSNMCARFLDAEDKPLKGITLSLESPR